MSTESNKATLRRYYAEVFSRWDFSNWDELVDKDYVMHLNGRDYAGQKGGKQTADAWQVAAPDRQTTIDEMVAEGEFVAIRGAFKATHTGSTPNMPATGKKFTREFMALYRFKNGRIAEGWSVQDMLGQYRQLGITTIPTPAAQPAATPAR